MIIKVINFRTHTNSRIYGAKARIAVRPQIIEMFSKLGFSKTLFLFLEKHLFPSKKHLSGETL